MNIILKVKLCTFIFMICLSIIKVLKIYTKNDARKRKLKILEKIIWVSFCGLLFRFILEQLGFDMKDFIKFMKM